MSTWATCSGIWMSTGVATFSGITLGSMDGPPDQRPMEEQWMPFLSVEVDDDLLSP